MSQSQSKFDVYIRFNYYGSHVENVTDVISIPIPILHERSVATPATAKENHSPRVCYADEESTDIIRIREAFLCWCIACNLSLHVSSCRWNCRAKTASFVVAISRTLVSARWKGFHYSSVRPTMRAMGGVYLTFTKRSLSGESSAKYNIISFRLRKHTYASS